MYFFGNFSMRFYLGIRGAPLVEIFGVTIECNDDELLEGKCDIYGHISVTDELSHHSFDIYGRDRDSPESISFGKPLLLTPPLDAYNAAIIPSEHVKVDVALYDRSRHDMVIVQGNVTLDGSCTEDWLNDFRVKQIVPGLNKFNANVHYAIFPYAVIATVRVLFFSNDDHFDLLKYDDDDDDDEGEKENWRFESMNAQDVKSYENNSCQTTANLFGYVSAFASVHGRDGENHLPSSLLFRKSKEESVEVKSGDFIQMSKSVVAVPAYSSLNVEAAFSFGGTQLTVVSGTVVFKASDRCKYKKDIVGDNGSRIRVQVAWSDAYKQLYRRESFRPETAEKDGSITMEPLSVCEGSRSDALHQLYGPEICHPKTQESIMMESLSSHAGCGSAPDQLYRPESFGPINPGIYDSKNVESSLTPEHSSSAALSANEPISNLSEDHCSETSSDNCTMSEDDFSETSETFSDYCVLPRGPDTFKTSLVEIYSVVLCSKDATPLKFYGSVVVVDSYRYLVFRVRKSRPQDCPSSGMLAVVGDGGAHRSFYMDGELAVVVDFNDISGAIISQGVVTFRGISSGPCNYNRMYNVIHGERGFVAVHYSIFADGVSAAVKITLTNKNCPGVIKGKIYARHVTSDESSRSYHKNLFKSLLFCDEHEGASLYTPGVALPLVKSIISLPRFSHLIIEADVLIWPDDDDDDSLSQDAKSVRGSVTFTHSDVSPRKICDDLYVSVKFSEAA